ncbi:DUF58 domain-containing protein [Bifidobacterium eulemuris]|uniref:DUF58 domain-containing protein n=1 Tax=Bifidobacterium eulemuris TaxID=1765219 RepID=A0A261GCB4_9BIFI|nr:DUF58 domain-containing protein [Bifidobacterium eulemuris]OZG68616.1 DUF58 domain-containing protein [Bifidobacterium eulemuris]QOL32737.1 DUF58 domain-containing protein [Bifidobacterium eulemuris]
MAASAVACLALFPYCGWHELLTFGLFSAVMMVAALLLSLGSMRYEASMRVSDRRVTVGDEVCVHMEIRAHGPRRFRIPVPFVDLPIDGMHTRFAIPALPSEDSAVIDMRHIAEVRTVLEIGPPLVWQGDPFGLVRRERSLCERVNVFVHPATVRLALPRTGTAHDFEGLASGRIVSDDLDLHGLRPYEFGDDIRHAHWLSSVKSGRLMIRQYEETCRSDASLTLDVNAGHYSSSEEFELAVSIHASIGLACLEQGRMIATHAGTTHRMPRDAVTLLDAASAIRPDGDGPIPIDETVHHTPHASWYGLVVGSNIDIDQIARATTMLPRSARRVVVRAALDESGDVFGLAGFTVVTIGSLKDLPSFAEVII